MIALLIIADDFTGALDTGVKFAECGASVRIVADYSCEFEKMDQKTQVLVVDVESRHIDGKHARERVYEIVKRARKAGIPYIYKKTDSALRGNVGNELEGMLAACGNTVLHFFPAFPKMGRTTVQGIHFIDGVPVGESVFAEDPFDPVTCSEVAGIIHQQSKITVRTVTDGTILEEADEPMVAVYDTKTDEELRALALELKQKKQLGVMAGCAGMAEYLPELLHLTGPIFQVPAHTAKFLVVCGSVNPITRKQLDFAEAYGFCRIRLNAWQKLEKSYFKTETGQKKIREFADILKKVPCCILDSNDEDGREDTLLYAREHNMSMDTVRKRITDTMGYLLKELLQMGIESTIMITGGDTLLGFMNQIHVYEMVPIREVAPGTVLSQFEIDGTVCEIISKSGGFGNEGLLVDLAKELMRKEEEKIPC